MANIILGGSQSPKLMNMMFIDFVGPIAPASKYGQKRYILVAIDYVTKWAEVIAMKIDTANTVATFLYENIITHFG